MGIRAAPADVPKHPMVCSHGFPSLEPLCAWISSGLRALRPLKPPALPATRESSPSLLPA